MKPARPEQLAELLTRALGALCRQEDQVFLCRNGAGLYRIPRKSILYFVSDRRKVTCVTATRSYTFYGKLDEVARELGEGFVRIHQRYLVRAAAMDRVEGNTVSVGEEELPISRSHQATALAALARTLLE